MAHVLLYYYYINIIKLLVLNISGKKTDKTINSPAVPTPSQISDHSSAGKQTIIQPNHLYVKKLGICKKPIFRS